jgi:hypothetical protein
VSEKFFRLNTYKSDAADMAYQMREFGIKDPNGYALILGEDISKK